MTRTKGTPEKEEEDEEEDERDADKKEARGCVGAGYTAELASHTFSSPKATSCNPFFPGAQIVMYNLSAKGKTWF
jgi:hypothetical protein